MNITQGRELWWLTPELWYWILASFGWHPPSLIHPAAKSNWPLAGSSTAPTRPVGRFASNFAYWAPVPPSNEVTWSVDQVTQSVDCTSSLFAFCVISPLFEKLESPFLRVDRIWDAKHNVIRIKAVTRPEVPKKAENEQKWTKNEPTFSLF